jgi:hypothetical protein
LDKHKSEYMSEVADQYGWKTQIKPTIPESKRYDEIVWDLYCVRDKETLHVQWTGNRLTDATYSFCGSKTKPTHKAAVLKIIGGEPSLKQVAKRKRSQDYNRIVEDISESRELPFDPNDTPALTVLKSVIGRDITWVRKIDGEVCTGFVPKLKDTNPKYLRVIVANSGRRILEWSDGEGFHAVALEQIIEVA